jgi:hypothetical protein
MKEIIVSNCKMKHTVSESLNSIFPIRTVCLDGKGRLKRFKKRYSDLKAADSGYKTDLVTSLMSRGTVKGWGRGGGWSSAQAVFAMHILREPVSIKLTHHGGLTCDAET